MQPMGIQPMAIQSMGRQPMVMQPTEYNQWGCSQLGCRGWVGWDAAKEKYGAQRQGRGQHDSNVDFQWMIQGCGQPVTMRKMEKWQSSINNILLFLKGYLLLKQFFSVIRGLNHDDDSSQMFRLEARVYPQWYSQEGKWYFTWAVSISKQNQQIKPAPNLCLGTSVILRDTFFFFSWK